MKHLSLLVLSIFVAACSLDAPPTKADKNSKTAPETKAEAKHVSVEKAPEEHPVVTSDNSGRTALFYAKSADIVRALWNFRSPSSRIPAYAATDNFYQTPLHFFASTGMNEGVEVYVEKFCRGEHNPAGMFIDSIFGNFLNKPDIDGRTALHRAVRANDLKVVETLVKCASVDLETQDHFKRTPLHDAAELSDFSIGFILLRAARERFIELRLDLPDIHNETPLQIARRNKSQEAISVLETLEIMPK